MKIINRWWLILFFLGQEMRVVWVVFVQLKEEVCESERERENLKVR